MYAKTTHLQMKQILIFILSFFHSFIFTSSVLFAQGDLTHEVAADTERWPVPEIDPSWKLEYMPHNNANHNVYVYKDKLYDGLFTRTLGWNGVSTTASMERPQLHQHASASPATFRATALWCRLQAKTDCPAPRAATRNGLLIGCSAPTHRVTATIIVAHTCGIRKAKRLTRR